MAVSSAWVCLGCCAAQRRRRGHHEQQRRTMRSWAFSVLWPFSCSRCSKTRKCSLARVSSTSRLSMDTMTCGHSRDTQGQTRPQRSGQAAESLEFVARVQGLLWRGKMLEAAVCRQHILALGRTCCMVTTCPRRLSITRCNQVYTRHCSYGSPPYFSRVCTRSQTCVYNTPHQTHR